MKIKRNIALSDSGFVFNPSSGDSFSANPIGMEIIKMLKENKSQDDIKKYILSAYMTDEVTFENDFYDFTKLLVKLDLLESGEVKKQ